MSLDFFLGDNLTGYVLLNEGNNSERLNIMKRNYTHAWVFINREGFSKQESDTLYTNLKKAIREVHLSYILLKKRKIKNNAEEGEKEITYEDTLYIFSRSAVHSFCADDETMFSLVLSLFKQFNDGERKFLKERFTFKPKDAIMTTVYNSEGKVLSEKEGMISETDDDISAFEDEKDVETEWFIIEKPMCYSGRHVRALKGEIF
ncbi:MAG: hypothetical protein PUI24_06550 [Spirochaetales bacterium]|nr:hypothetical protein [Spirochaetales bacterium]MDY2924490.1 hypothetical protein [Treponema sp.]